MQLEAENARLKESLAKSSEVIVEKDEKIASLENQLYWLRKKVFGKMSEKHLPIDPAQLSLFSTESISEEQKAEADKASAKTDLAITKAIAVKEKPARRSLDTTGLPIVETYIYPEGTADKEGKLLPEYVVIGQEESSRLERVPAKVYVAKTIRVKVIHKSEIKDNLPEDRRIQIAPLPLAPVDRCMAGASVLSDLIISKFMYHLPFYRLIKQYKESGITIPDSTIGGWYEAAVEKLHPLYRLLKERVLRGEYLQADESTVPVMDDKKTRKGYMWVVRDVLTGEVVFHYDLGSREGEVAKELFTSFKGILQSDGYNAYNQFETVEEITMAGCWAHARRKWVDALDENKAYASHAINTIAGLYAIEKKADDLGLSTEERKELRRKESYPIICEFEKWMEEIWVTVPPKSRVGEAIKYAFSLLPRLSSFVNDGRILLDNNLIENVIRPLALGRKNWLFCGNDASAYRAAIVYSLISSCQSAGVDPREWMEDVLCKLPYYNRDGRDLTELLPKDWAASRQHVTE